MKQVFIALTVANITILNNSIEIQENKSWLVAAILKIPVYRYF
jgi:hypothetical protein